jgi:hypothetical protein
MSLLNMFLRRVNDAAIIPFDSRTMLFGAYGYEKHGTGNHDPWLLLVLLGVSVVDRTLMCILSGQLQQGANSHPLCW